jgi:pSer/pThr/pTyr-binding forkhead associated (FHA) protein/tetratricopeptide (TPR) repeat protein
MARLKVFKDKVLVQELGLDPQQTYLAGRGETCQIHLDPEAGISRQHFQISNKGGVWKLEVLSRYGELYLDGQKSPGVMVSKDTSFSVPPYDFELNISENANVDSAEAGGDSGAERTMVSVLPSSAHLRLVDATGKVRQVFRLEGDAWVGGRDLTCSLFIDNPKISRKQFELYREAENYFIRDLGSSNGTLVNGHAISQNEWTHLDSGDVIAVVDWSLQFELRDASFQDRVKAVDAHLQGPMIIDDPVEGVNGAFSESKQEATNYGPIPTDNQYAPPPPHPEYPSVPDTQYSYQVGGPPSGEEGLPNVATSQGWRQQITPLRIGLALLILALLGYAVFDNMKKEDKPAPIAKPKIPFDTLGPEDQQMVMQAYHAAELRMARHEYQEALQEIARIKDKIPYYEESRELEKTAQAGLAKLEEMKREEQLEREKAETEERIQKQIILCRAEMDPETATVSTVETCLASVIPLNPDHPGFQTLKAEAEKYIADRQVRATQHEAYLADVKKLRVLWDKAVDLDKRQETIEAVKAYDVVAHAQHADPGGLRKKAANRREELISKMASDQAEFEREADQFTKDGKHREAVLALKKALAINPENEVIKGHLSQVILELKKQMQVIYQESILEESVGDVDTAKTKWRKILELSLPGEDYYDKARFKLKKYGVI